MIFDGYLKGMNYNKETKEFEVFTLGTKEDGAIIVGIQVSGKDKDGNKIYGAPVKTKIRIKSEGEASRVMRLIKDGELVEFDGFFVADNYTNKEGKEIKGHMAYCNDSTTLIAKEKRSSQPKQAAKVDYELDVPW